jgi:hypothetical protein
MSPFSELISRINRVLVLLVVARHGHACTVGFEGMRRHALVDDVVIWDFDFARELNVVVLRT